MTLSSETTAVDSALVTTPLAHRGRLRRWLTITAAVAVPLALVGLALAAVGDGTSGLERIPAAVVNNDELLTTTDADGNDQIVFAGRQLVTELTGGSDSGFDWYVTNSAEAQAALERGEVYAVLTIPSDFSASLLTIGSPDPVQAQLNVVTDDAHSYLAGSVVQAVGSGLAQQFGAEITAQYLDGLTSGLGELGAALDTAADGATQLGDGASALSSGLVDLSAGASASAGGARELASGVTDYTVGVSGLSTGLTQLRAGATQLEPLQQAAAGIPASAGTLAGDLSALSAAITASNLSPADQQAFVDALSAAQVLAGTTGTVIPQLNGGLDGIQSGLAQSAGGAAQLAAGGAPLRSGAQDLASGLGALAGGTSDITSGAESLASGVDELASGLSSGAGQVPEAGDSSVATEPVVVESTRTNAVAGVGSVIAETLVPIGLWIGALATFLALRPAARGVIGTSAAGGIIVRRAMGRASFIALAQAALVTVLVHLVSGVDWALAPATLAFTTVIALAFTAFHAALTLTLGRAGMVVSLLLLAVQIVATGGIVPIAALADPFPALSTVLPLTYAVDGMQALLAGGDPARVVAAVAVMGLLAAGSLIVARLAVGRARRRDALAAFAPTLVATTA
ncbi:YhgE/Pip family protein [Microcella sp.]|uniref:YhgE/Pip family protein n=1 Tax=Microcella sp. TaxID=1913979 RepID=UPI00299F7DA7|nr:YhgE/Pip family protein [Microcella sp.]MDX2026521.1 YhgE/Pip family protein [Microcella sp.]